MPRMRTLTNRIQFCHDRNTGDLRILWLPSGNKNQPGTLNNQFYDWYLGKISHVKIWNNPTETAGFWFCEVRKHPKTSIFWGQKTYLKHWTWVGFGVVLGWKQESGVQIVYCHKLAGVFIFLMFKQSLGKWSNLICAYCFKWVEKKHQLAKVWRLHLRFVVFFQGIPQNPCKFKGVSPDVFLSQATERTKEWCAFFYRHDLKYPGQIVTTCSHRLVTLNCGNCQGIPPNPLIQV